jgi:hypothetical protein
MEQMARYQALVSYLAVSDVSACVYGVAISEDGLCDAS